MNPYECLALVAVFAILSVTVTKTSGLAVRLVESYIYARRD